VLDLPSVFTAGDGLGAEALRLLRAFGESYLPVEPALGTPQEIQQLLERAAGLLENFGRSFLELQRGYEEFGKEMGVRTVQPEGALYRARDARQVLSYLLDPRAAGRDRELQRAFADFMIHQVALLRGVAEGAQELLGELSPEAIEEAAPKSAWTGRAAALWKKYEERYHELADEEDAVTELLFGKQFARAYAALVGRRSTGDGDGKPVAAEDDDDPES
jgi:predicted component of type VI protein secretion system